MRKIPRLCTVQAMIIFTIVARLFWLNSPMGIPHGWNEVYYLRRAYEIANGGSYLNGQFDNPPLFTYLISLIIKVTGPRVWICRLFIVSICAMNSYLVYRIGSLFLNRKKAISAGYLYGFFPMDVAFGRIIQIDNLMILFILLTIYFLMNSSNGLNGKKLFFAGASYGLALFTKFSSIILIPLLIYFLIKKIRNAKSVAIFIAAVAAVQLPWYAYSFITKPEFIQLSQAGRNVFHIMDMYVPTYKIIVLIFASIYLLVAIFYFNRFKAENYYQSCLQILILSAILFNIFYPIHEYYLLPSFPPLFLYVVAKHKEKTIRSIGIIFIISSLFFISLVPLIQVDYGGTASYIKNEFDENRTIACSNQPLMNFYLNGLNNNKNNDENKKYSVTILNRENLGDVVVITSYDKICREDLVNYVKENYAREKILRNAEIYTRY